MVAAVATSSAQSLCRAQLLLVLLQLPFPAFAQSL